MLVFSTSPKDELLMKCCWYRLRSYAADDVMAVVDNTGFVAWVPPVTYHVPCSENNGVYNCSVKSVILSISLKLNLCYWQLI